MEDIEDLNPPPESLRVFLSWSGDASRSIATALNAWIPLVFGSEQVKVFFSPYIPGGTEWTSALRKALHENQFGVVVLTRENKNNLWIQFESGALSKSLDEGAIVPLLFGFGAGELADNPLAKFQSIAEDAVETPGGALAAALYDHMKRPATSRADVLERGRQLWLQSVVPTVAKALTPVSSAAAGPAAAPKGEEHDVRVWAARVQESMEDLRKSVDRAGKRQALLKELPEVLDIARILDSLQQRTCALEQTVALAVEKLDHTQSAQLALIERLDVWEARRAPDRADPQPRGKGGATVKPNAQVAAQKLADLNPNQLALFWRTNRLANGDEVRSWISDSWPQTTRRAALEVIDPFCDDRTQLTELFHALSWHINPDR